MDFRKELTGEWAYAVSNCNDIQRLKQTFQIQNTLYPPLDYATSGTLADLSSVMASVRLLSRYGVKVEAQNRTIKHLADMRLTGELQKIYCEQAIKPILSSTSTTLFEQNLKKYESYGSGNNLEQLAMTFWPLLSPALAPQKYTTRYDLILASAFDPVESRLLTTHVDRLRIHTATRIYMLQHGNTPENLEALVPEFFEEVPLDKFASPPRPYRQLNGKYYSVGFNNGDDNMSISDYKYNEKSDIYLISTFEFADFIKSKESENNKNMVEEIE